MPRLALPFVLLAAGPLFADGPKDNVPDKVRPVPPKGAAVSDADRAELTAGLAEFGKDLDALPAALAGKPALLDLVPDVEVYHKAVRYALELDEMYIDKGRDDARVCKNLLKQGRERAKQLRDGNPTWPIAAGLVVRGYRSKIDGSVQPYGLVVPASFLADRDRKRRLDFWWHGRGEVLTEANFIDGRQRSPGEFTPADTFVVHPYGRYCNANKFAGEVDTFEVLEHVRRHYAIDDNRIVARGFSMGGAACWQFATHFPTLWCAAAPGAGFAETPEFLNNFQGEAFKPEWWERRLWRWYNATDYAENIFNLPTVAYSGEIDKQKQAADVMAREMKKVGLELAHVIGPKTAHSYEKNAKAEVNRRIDAIVATGKPAEPRPELRFVTHTLRCNRCGPITVEGLERHWQPAHVTAKYESGQYTITTRGVTGLTVEVPPGKSSKISIDGAAPVELPAPMAVRYGSDRDTGGSIRWFFHKQDGRWTAGRTDAAPFKMPGLQGPIDDAFLDRFLMVRPTGQPLNDAVGKWAAGEMKHAVEHWRLQFRGDAPAKDDSAITDDDIKTSNLVLWGDPQSNKLLAKIANRLPVKWTADGVVVNGQTYPADSHLPVLIYPNPLNPAKYVVLNSGFTFREYDYLNNARQVPKLPDYAVLDVRTPPNSRWPGKVVRAGFFGERWELLPDDGKGE